MFSFPQYVGQPYMADPTFMMKIQELQRDPNAINKHMQDPRILQVMGMLMGVNIQTADPSGAGCRTPGAKSRRPGSKQRAAGGGQHAPK